MGRAGAAPAITMCFLDSQHEGLRVGVQKGQGEGRKLTHNVFLVPVGPQVKARHRTQRPTVCF